MGPYREQGLALRTESREQSWMLVWLVSIPEAEISQSTLCHRRGVSAHGLPCCPSILEVQATPSLSKARRPPSPSPLGWRCEIARHAHCLRSSLEVPFASSHLAVSSSGKQPTVPVQPQLDHNTAIKLSISPPPLSPYLLHSFTCTVSLSIVLGTL